MKNTLTITLFVIVVCTIYSLVGNWVPQKEIHPPEDKVITDDMTTEDLVEIGEFIYSGKGTCLTCHTLARYPNLDNVGATAGDTREGLSDIEYLAESMYDPNTFLVEGFAAGMPPINRPPIALNDKEILAVVAYLQSKGGEATVTLETKLKWQSAEGSVPVAASVPSSAPAEARTPQQLIEKFTCAACHSMNDDAKMNGPSLVDVGSRLTSAQIYESLLLPDATIAKGYTPLMGTTLKGLNFYNDVSAAELIALTNYLSAKKGGK